VIIDGANPVEIPDRVMDIRFLGGVGEVGRSAVLVDDGETRLLYTGDFHTDDQRLVAVLLGEVKYSDAEQTFKQGLEELLTYQRFATQDDEYLIDTSY
jgi:Cft2 family RNA processing exonuclease